MSISVEPIEKGGSGRKFWRIRTQGDSCILVRYTTERADNAGYADIARFLHRVGVRVPDVLLHEPADGLLILEDMGSEDLFSFRSAPWPQRRMLYERTLEQAALLHTQAHLTKGCPSLQPPFDAALYAWEQDYFIEHCLGRHFGLDSHRIEEHVDQARLRDIAEQLAAAPRCLIHRDFQSQNVMIRRGQPGLIDFQGLRYGLAQYDVASLLLDPYAALAPAEREELLTRYVALASPADPENFRTFYPLCAMQRIMQALGAYGKLGHLDGRTHFLAHIPGAIQMLCDLTKMVEGLEGLSDLVSSLSAKARPSGN